MRWQIGLIVSIFLPHASQADDEIFVKDAALKVVAPGGGEGPAWHPELGVLMSGDNGDINLFDRMGKTRVYRKKAGTNGLLFDGVCLPANRNRAGSRAPKPTARSKC